MVDDDAGMRISLDGLIRSLGYRAAVFCAAEVFLESPEGRRAACVISDIEMPGGMDGITLAAKLLAASPDCPVILISAFVDERVCAAAERVGAFALIRKPFLGEALIDAIEEALAKKSE